MKLLISICVSVFICTPNNSSFAAARKSFDDVKPAAFNSSFQKANLRIWAKIGGGDEDEPEVPVKAEFYLLDKSLIEILKEANFNPVDEADTDNDNDNDKETNDKKSKREAKDEEYLKALAGLLLAEQDDEEESELLRFLFRESVDKHKISTVETDYFGRGRSAAVKPGNYYLFGFTQIEDETFIWNHRIWLAGRMNIVIDQNNAAVVLPAEF